jgi:hypothetical protein
LKQVAPAILIQQFPSEIGGCKRLPDNTEHLSTGTELNLGESMFHRWWRTFMSTLLQEIRYAARQLRNAPGFAALAVLTLALGISANTAMFTVIESVLLRPLPYAHSNQLIYVGPAEGEGFQSTSWAQSAVLPPRSGISGRADSCASWVGSGGYSFWNKSAP